MDGGNVEVVVGTAPTPSEIAERANAWHQKTKDVVQEAIEVGRELSQLKASLNHGEWLPWVEANLSFNQQYARKLMALAQRFGELQNVNRYCDSVLTSGSVRGAISEVNKLRVEAGLDQPRRPPVRNVQPSAPAIAPRPQPAYRQTITNAKAFARTLDEDSIKRLIEDLAQALADDHGFGVTVEFEAQDIRAD